MGRRRRGDLHRRLRNAAAALALALLGACAWQRDAVLARAAGAGLEPTRVRAGTFVLAAWHAGAAGKDRGRPLTVYIEGDGYAWARRDRPSSDPTPHDPVGLALAARDPARPLLYLARPCQFVADPACGVTWWTGRRYAAEVVDAIGQAIDRILATDGASGVSLVGYSGGGVIAALVAARRRDVVRLVTVAAPLDLDAWTSRLGLSPFPPGTSPVTRGAALSRIPQLHLAGALDRVVPPAVTVSFVRRLDLPAASLRVFPGRDHACCWARDWPAPAAAAR